MSVGLGSHNLTNYYLNNYLVLTQPGKRLANQVNKICLALGDIRYFITI